MSDARLALPSWPPRLPSAAPPPSESALRIAGLARGLSELSEEAARSLFGALSTDRVLKSTVSLCPDCLDHVPALVVAREGRVLIRKRCETHGASQAVLENDEAFYFLSNKDRSGRRYAEDRILEIPAYSEACCGDGGCGEAAGPDATSQASNKSCTILVEVTNACNLACPVCYSDARGDRKMPLDAFRRYMTALIEKKGGLDSVQLTGGEAILHPEFWEMVAFLHAEPRVKKILLPTNGILFVKPETAGRLAAFRNKVIVLLQFDGREARTNRALRDADPQRIRERLIPALERLGVAVQLTMTLSRGVNEHEVGAVIETGLRHGNVKVIALQPVTYSGRYDLAQDPDERLTLSDVVKAVAARAPFTIRREDFVPIPCSHPNCGWITLSVRRFGITRNVMRFVDLPRVMESVAYKTLLSTDELHDVARSSAGATATLRRWLTGLGARLVRSTDVFTIAVKPFMDRFSYDQDRIENCCHHLMDTKGNPVSFCEYNARVRTNDGWSALPRLDAPAG